MRFWHKFSTKFKVNLRQIQTLNFTQILNTKAKFSGNLRLNSRKNLRLNLHKIHAKFKDFLRNSHENLRINLNEIFGLNLKTPKFNENLQLNLRKFHALNFAQILNTKAKFSTNLGLNSRENLWLNLRKNLRLNLHKIHAKFKDFLRNSHENFGLNKIFGLNLKTPKFSENLRLNLNEIFGLNFAINSINLSPAKPYFYALCEISLLSKRGKIGREVER